MNIYYQVNLTGENDQADLLSIALSAANGLSAYFEINDYDEGKVDRPAEEHIISEFLGPDKLDELVADTKKLKCFICTGVRAKTLINSFLNPYDEIHLISYANAYQASAMIRLLNDENFSKRASVTNLESILVNEHEDKYESFKTELPSMNALRMAMFWKHLVRSPEIFYAENES